MKKKILHIYKVVRNNTKYNDNVEGIKAKRGLRFDVVKSERLRLKDHARFSSVRLRVGRNKSRRIPAATTQGIIKRAEDEVEKRRGSWQTNNAVVQLELCVVTNSIKF